MINIPSIFISMGPSATINLNLHWHCVLVLLSLGCVLVKAFVLPGFHPRANKVHNMDVGSFNNKQRGANGDKRLCPSFWAPHAEVGLKNSQDESSEYENDSTSKWEKMYYAADDGSAVQDEGDDDSFVESKSYDIPVSVISFDLDDCLWDTMGIINHANEALANFLALHYPQMSNISIPTEMRRIWNEHLARDATLGNEPANLSWLRREALREAAAAAGLTDPGAVAEEAFALWFHERQQVGPHLFPGVLDTLKQLKERGFLLGAISNGNADVQQIPELKGLLAFAVSSEEVGQRKPEAAPFLAAAAKAHTLGAPGPEPRAAWVHVGDDLTADCVGAKEGLQARTVLFWPPSKLAKRRRAEEEEEERRAAAVAAAAGDRRAPAAAQGGAVTFAEMGTEDYVAEMIKADFVDAEIERFDALLGVVDGWQREAAAAAAARRDFVGAAAAAPPPSAPLEEAAPYGGGGGSGRGEDEEQGAGGRAVTQEDLDKLAAIDINQVQLDAGMRFAIGKKGSNADDKGIIATKQMQQEEGESAANSIINNDDNNGIQKRDSAGPSAVLDFNAIIEKSLPQKSKPDQEEAVSSSLKKTFKFCYECGEKIPRQAKFCSECGTKQQAFH